MYTHANSAELVSKCITVASDASESAVGGGVFVPKDDGRFECIQFAHHMLRIKTRGLASALREMEGIVETIVAADPPRGSQ